MVPRRAAAGVGGSPADDEVSGGQGEIHGCACSLPRPGADERHRVVAVRARPGGERCGHPGLEAGREPRGREDVAGDLALAGIIGESGCLPVCEGAAKELDELLVVDCEE